MHPQKITKQLSEWAGEMGKKYTDRNPQSLEEFDRLYLKDYDVTRSSMNEEFLALLPRDLSILEVGANVGTQLEFLRRVGFSNLTGIEINEYAVSRAKELYPDVRILHGSGFDLPFDSASFDLVYTSGVLIHISPGDVGTMLSEMHRVSRHYIWGFEYYAPEYSEVTYRGTEDLLWKADFSALFKKTFPDLETLQEKKYPMTDGHNMSQMYLLEKKNQHTNMSFRYCTRCVMPNTKPDLFFDEAGVCDACNSALLKKEIDWVVREQEFAELVARFKGINGSNYDCVIPVSGGKDSHYQAYMARKYGLNPLLVNFEATDRNDLGRKKSREYTAIRRHDRVQKKTTRCTRRCALRHSAEWETMSGRIISAYSRSLSELPCK